MPQRKVSEDAFIAEIKDLASSEAIAQILSSPPVAEPNIYYRSSEKEESIKSVQALLRQAENDHRNGNFAVCVIENISPADIRVLGPGLSLDPFFFANHAENIAKELFWKEHIPWSWDSTHWTEIAAATSAHIDGMFEYYGLEHGTFELTSSPNNFPRYCFKQDPYPIQSNTRISYCRANKFLYLFLVDAPLALENLPKPKESTSRTTLRFRYCQSRRGGVPLPQLFSQQKYSLLESFKSIFQHTWHFRLLLNDGIPQVLPAHAMLYMFSSSLWETNLRFLDSDIKRISFRDLRDPKKGTNDQLHDRREDLEDLKALVSETVTWAPSTISQYFEKLCETDDHLKSSPLGRPIENLKRIQQDAADLQIFLNDTFQLLMSSIAVRDSKASMEQAQRSQWLTQLASLYLPLSVLTGIFGMNLKEINGSSVPFWWSIVVLAILAACTALAYFALSTFGKWRRKRKAKRKIYESV